MKITDLIKKDSVKLLTSRKSATFATIHPTTVATVADDENEIYIQEDSQPKVPSDEELDKYCWPNSEAFNTHEIAVSFARSAMISKRLNEKDTEHVIDLLIKRDRELLDMAYCFECLHLRGYGKGPWSCANSIKAEVDLKKTEVLVPRDWPYRLQRCPRFKPMLT